MIVEKAANMARMMQVDVVGLVENMSYLKCPDCGKEIKIFGESHIEQVAAAHGITRIAKLPINPKVASAVDAGCVELADTDELEPLAEFFATL
jgi:Mrp family chromosome partitioning ATPase